MPTFAYRHPDGREIEREYPIGKARKWILFDGKRCERAVSMPSVILPSFGLGRKPSVSRQLPTFYGYRDREGAWSDHMKRAKVEDTKENRMRLLQAEMGPSLADQERRARKNAEKAGALGEFDSKGRPLAHTTRGVANHVARGRAMGDKIGWE